MIHVNATDFRNRIAHWMDRAADDHVPLLITRQGHEPSVLMTQSDYDSMVETLYLKSTTANAARLDASIAELNAGKGIERELLDL
jgi:antitoxin YefM